MRKPTLPRKMHWNDLGFGCFLVVSGEAALNFIGRQLVSRCLSVARQLHLRVLIEL